MRRHGRADCLVQDWHSVRILRASTIRLSNLTHDIVERIAGLIATVEAVGLLDCVIISGDHVS